MDGHGDEFESPFDDNLGEAGLGKAVGQILADFEILSDLLGVVTTTPVRVPTTGDTDSVRNRICFLSHNYFSSDAVGLTSRITVTWFERLRILPARP